MPEKMPEMKKMLADLEAQNAEVQAMLQEIAKEAGISEERFKAIQDAIARGATFSDIFNISQDSLEAGYALAYNLYNARNYKDAETMFRGLCFYDSTDARYWMGLAACLQAREDWQGAFTAYEYAAVHTALNNPNPLFQAGICCLKLNKDADAAVIFQAALELGDDSNPAHKACHDRIKALLKISAKDQKEAS